MGSPTQPTPRRISTVERPTTQSQSKRPIDLQDALASTVRAWLAARDAALLTFCSGVEGETLTQISLDSSLLISAVDKMNRLRTLALEFASQVDDRLTGQSVLAEAVESLLAEESPKFLLRLDHLPEAF